MRPLHRQNWAMVNVTMKHQKKKRCKQPNKTVIQNHHIIYFPIEWKVPVYKGEHQLLTYMNWRKRTSIGFLIALQDYINMQKTNAVNLGETKKEESPA